MNIEWRIRSIGWLINPCSLNATGKQNLHFPSYFRRLLEGHCTMGFLSIRGLILTVSASKRIGFKKGQMSYLPTSHPHGDENTHHRYLPKPFRPRLGTPSPNTPLSSRHL